MYLPGSASALGRAFIDDDDRMVIRSSIACHGLLLITKKEENRDGGWGIMKGLEAAVAACIITGESNGKV